MKNFACILLFAFMALVNTVESGVGSSRLYNNPQYQRYLESDDYNIQWDQNGRPIGRIIRGVFVRFEEVPKEGPVTFKNGDELFRLGVRRAVYHGEKFYEMLPNGQGAEFTLSNGDVVLSNSLPHAVRENDAWRHHRHVLVHDD